MVGVITLMDVCVIVDGVGLTAVLVGSKQYTNGVYYVIVIPRSPEIYR